MDESTTQMASEQVNELINCAIAHRSEPAFISTTDVVRKMRVLHPGQPLDLNDIGTRIAVAAIKLHASKGARRALSMRSRAVNEGSLV